MDADERHGTGKSCFDDVLTIYEYKTGMRWAGHDLAQYIGFGTQKELTIYTYLSKYICRTGLFALAYRHQGRDRVDLQG